MLSVAEARSRLISILDPVSLETIPIEQVLNRVLAYSLLADSDSPRFDNSSMDGFAVRAVDIQGATEETPAVLQVIGDIPAGTQPNMTLAAGNAARIMTGAPLPAGADTIVPVEHTNVFNEKSTALPDQVSVYQSHANGAYIRPKGEDFGEGTQVLPAGRRLQPQDIGMLAMFGQAQVAVHRQPRIALFSSGDEILPIDQPLQPGRIRDTNTYSLAALLQTANVEVINLGVAKDTLEAVTEKLESAVSHQVDMIISSAGVSVGEYDFVRTAVENQGSLDFWKVNMRPGKPLVVGDYRDIPFVGLPGNPVSSFIGFEVFLRPALAYLSGDAFWQRTAVAARTTEEIHSDGRESYLRAALKWEQGEYQAALTGHQGSGNLFSLVQANGLLIVPAGEKVLAKGSTVQAWQIANFKRKQ